MKVFDITSFFTGNMYIFYLLLQENVSLMPTILIDIIPSGVLMTRQKFLELHHCRNMNGRGKTCKSCNVHLQKAGEFPLLHNI